MVEEILVTARHNAKIDPSLGIWTWEISVYLFFGGLTAGLIVFAALAMLDKNRPPREFSINKLALWAPIALSLGMTTLFLDLEHKLFVFRFYTTFEPSSPMSWGAWILVLIYPLMIVQIASTLRAGYPALAGLAGGGAGHPWQRRSLLARLGERRSCPGGRLAARRRLASAPRRGPAGRRPQNRLSGHVPGLRRACLPRRHPHPPARRALGAVRRLERRTHRARPEGGVVPVQSSRRAASRFSSAASWRA